MGDLRVRRPRGAARPPGRPLEVAHQGPRARARQQQRRSERGPRPRSPGTGSAVDGSRAARPKRRTRLPCIGPARLPAARAEAGAAGREGTATATDVAAPVTATATDVAAPVTATAADVA